MGRYLVSTRTGQPVEVDAPNWLVALGVGLDALGTVTSIDRLACEVLANGKVIARDARTGLGFIVQAVDADDADDDVPAEPEDLVPTEDPVVEIYDDPSLEESITTRAPPDISSDAPLIPLAAEEDEEDDDTFVMPGLSDEDTFSMEEDDEEEDVDARSEEEDEAWEDEAAFFSIGTDNDLRPEPILREVTSDPVYAPLLPEEEDEVPILEAAAEMVDVLPVMVMEDIEGDEPIALGAGDSRDGYGLEADALEAVEADALEAEMLEAAASAPPVPDPDEDVLAVGGADESDALEAFGAEDMSSIWAASFGGEGELLSEDELAADPALQPVLERIQASVTADIAWEVSLTGAQEVIPAESGAALRQEWDGTMRFIAALGPQAHKVLGERVPEGLGIVGFCVQRRVGLLIREPAQDPRFFANIDRRTGYSTRSILAMPVSFEGTTFGCLELLNPPERFTANDMERLNLIATALAEQLLIAV